MIGNTAVSVGGIVWVGRRAGRPFPGECGELQFDAAFAGNGLFRTEGHASCAGMTPSLCTCRAGERSALQDLLFPSVGFERVFNIQGGGVDVSVRFRGVVVPVWGLGSDVSDRMRQYCREIKGIKIIMSFSC